MTTAQLQYYENWGKPEPIVEQFELLGILPHTKPNAIGLWPNEQLCLVWSALQCAKNKNWLEIGSFCGGSTILLGLTIEYYDNFGKQGKIIAVDSAFDPMFDLNVKRSKLRNIEKLQINSLELLQHYTDPIGFAFIDGWHSFRNVIKEFEVISNIIDDDGIIAFHDVSPQMTSHDQKYIDLCYEHAKQNWDQLMNDETQNFRLDEAISVICIDFGYKVLDIPVRKDIKHERETGLTTWVRGTTSPFNAYTAIRRHP
jgi:predicted O-methyltransferase YrrM